MLAKWELVSFESVSLPSAPICRENSWAALRGGKGVWVSFLRKTLSAEKPQGRLFWLCNRPLKCGMYMWLSWFITNGQLYRHCCYRMLGKAALKKVKEDVAFWWWNQQEETLYTSKEQNVDQFKNMFYVNAPKSASEWLINLVNQKINCNCSCSVKKKWTNLLSSSNYIGLYTMQIVSKHLHTNKHENDSVNLLS